MDGNVLTIQVATMDAEIVPYFPFGKQAMTMLCFPMDPRVYALGSFDGFGRRECIRSSIPVAAVCSFDSAQIHPTV